MTSRTRVRFYTLSSLLFQCGVTAGGVFYTTRLAEVFGLSNAQIMTLNVFFFVGGMILELPTGWLADRFAPKWSICAGLISWSATGVVYSLGFEYYHFVLAELCGALGAAFMSGASDAYLQALIPNEDKFDDYYRFKSQLVGVGKIVTGVSVGFLGDYLNSFEVGYTIATFLLLASAAMVFFGFSSQGHIKPEESAFQSILFVLRNRTLMRIALIDGFQRLFIAPVFMLWAPYLSSLGASKTFLGMAVTFIPFGIIAGQFFEAKSRKALKRKPFVWVVISSIVKGLTLVLLSVYGHSIPSFISLLMVFEVVYGFEQMHLRLTAKSYWFQRRDQALVASSFSLIGRLGSAVGNLTMGFVADGIGRTETWTFSGVSIVVLTLLIGYSHTVFKSKG